MMVKTINLKTKTKSVHYLKDLAFFQVALGFIHNSFEDKKTNPLKNSEKIEENNKLIKHLESIIASRYFFFSRLTKSDLKKKDDFAMKLLKSFTKIASIYANSINIELLAMYIYYARYSDNRKKYLHEDFNNFSENKYIFEVAALICEVENFEDSGLEYKIAYEFAKVL